MKVFEYSNIGRRDINQDYIISMLLSQEVSVHLVADGMGGYDWGEVASKVVGDSFVDSFNRGLSIVEATQEASKNLRLTRQNLGITRMGSTVAGVLIKNNNAEVFWAGDSRVYIYRDNKLLYQTTDHSVVNELSQVRQLTFEEKERLNHIVTRSIMGVPTDEVDTAAFSLQSGDEILICTDGIYKDCPIDYLIESIRENRFDIDKQNEGFTDNHSLIYIEL